MVRDTADHVKVLTLDIASSSLMQIKPIVVEMGLEMLTADGVTDALNQIEHQHPDVLLLNLEPQEGAGYNIIDQMQSAAQEIPVIFLSNSPGEAPELAGRTTATVTLPIVPDDLKEVLGRITTPVRSAPPVTSRVSTDGSDVGTVAELGDYGDLLCHSSGMRDVMNMVEQVAATNITVLVRGESGTGKELIARTLYQRSLRSEKPFVKVLCAALPEGLLESELFGYERGAFTGAHKRKPGKFEIAHNGTIFLDEIGEVPITLQSKLLQVLQDGEFVRLGGEQDVRVDTRIIAATNRSLEEMVKQGTFREDLFYRLNVVTITIPPLRDRLEEVPFLCDHFVKKFSMQYEREFPGLSQATMDYFMSYPWPGNIRELENMIKQIVVLGDERAVLQKFEQFGGTMGPPTAIPVAEPGTPGMPVDMPPPSQVTPPPPVEHPVAPSPEVAPPLTAEPSAELVASIERGIAEGHLPLKEIGKHAASLAEREAILRVLNVTRWNRRKAAQILDISYKALLYKIRDYGLNTD
ncbi:MAG: sigma 54-interacting transcriptional regulator [Leptospirillia bacterium]